MPCENHPHPWVPYQPFCICACETSCSFCFENLGTPIDLVKHVYATHTGTRQTGHYAIFQSLSELHMKPIELIRAEYILEPCQCDSAVEGAEREVSRRSRIEAPHVNTQPENTHEYPLGKVVYDLYVRNVWKQDNPVYALRNTRSTGEQRFGNKHNETTLSGPSAGAVHDLAHNSATSPHYVHQGTYGQLQPQSQVHTAQNVWSTPTSSDVTHQPPPQLRPDRSTSTAFASPALSTEIFSKFVERHPAVDTQTDSQSSSTVSSDTAWGIPDASWYSLESMDPMMASNATRFSPLAPPTVFSNDEPVIGISAPAGMQSYADTPRGYFPSSTTPAGAGTVSPSHPSIQTQHMRESMELDNTPVLATSSWHPSTLMSPSFMSTQAQAQVPGELLTGLPFFSRKRRLPNDTDDGILTGSEHNMGGKRKR